MAVHKARQLLRREGKGGEEIIGIVGGPKPDARGHRGIDSPLQISAL